MQNIHILIATPCYGGVIQAGYMNSILGLWSLSAKLGFQITVETLENESVFTRARSYYVARMLENKQYTHILNIDADIIFDPESVVRLLEADKDVIAGCYPRKSINLERIIELAQDRTLSKEDIEAISQEYIVNITTPDYSPKVCTVENGFMQVGHVGGGFILIKRQVLEKLALAHPELKFVGGIRGYNPPGFEDHLYSLWEYMIDPVSKRYLSDDFAFCKRWYALGGEIWADLLCNLIHVGSHNFKGSYSKHLKYASSHELQPLPPAEHPNGCPTWRIATEKTNATLPQTSP